MNLLQGNTYNLELTLYSNNNEVIPFEKINQVQVILGNIEKFYKANAESEITYKDGVFIIPLSQEETFSLEQDSFTWEVRVLFNDGQVDGTGKQRGSVSYSKTRKVLKLEV